MTPATWTFETVTGLFVQSDANAPDGNAFDVVREKTRRIRLKLTRKQFATPYFGLKSQDWSALRRSVAELLHNKEPQEQYKVFFLARHGEGVHNVAEAKYGKEAWEWAFFHCLIVLKRL